MRSLAPFLLVTAVFGCTPPSVDQPTGEGEGEGEGGEGEEGEGEGEEGEGEEGEGEEGEGEGGGACTGGVVEGCVADGDDFACTLSHGGRTREYVLHVPAGVGASATSLVFNFHGFNTTAGLQQYLSHMNDDADANGYVVVYPKGIGLSWNAGACCGDAASQQVDDVGFTLAMIEQISETLCIDRSRIYSTGLSNGGHMSYRLACEHADVFAAIASVAGTITTATPCTPSRAIPVLHFHGNSDGIVNYDVGIDGVHGAERCTDDFAGYDSCSDQDEVTYQQGEVTCRARTGCSAGSDVELCTIEGGGHQWPGGNDIPLLGHNTADVDATARIWSFFEAHPL